MQRGVQEYDLSQYWRLGGLKAGRAMQERGCLAGEKSDMSISRRDALTEFLLVLPNGLLTYVIDLH